VIQHSQLEPPKETTADNNDNYVDASSGIQQEERVITASTKEQLSPDEDMRPTSGKNYPPMPNSAPLHITEMINNVVQDIDTFRLGSQVKISIFYIHTRNNTTVYVGITEKSTIIR
jgi:hypothetical protein